MSNFALEYIKARDLNWKELRSTLEPNDPSFWSKANKFTVKVNFIVQALKDSDGTYKFEDSDISRIMTQKHLMKPPDDTDEFDVEWFHNVNHNATQYIEPEKMALNMSENSLPYNIDIQYSGVWHAVARVRSNSAPGPDGILPTEGGESLKKALHI